MFDAAIRVVGIDREPRWIERARARFPQCTFLACDWSALATGARDAPAGDGPLAPDARFDVILCASAPQYAADQGALVAAMMGRLRPGGLLVLEMGVAGPENGAGGAEETGPGGEPGRGWLIVRRGTETRRFPTWAGMRALLAPYAWKHMGSGKSTAARRLFPAARLVSGDGLWAVARASAEVGAELHALAASQTDWLRLDKLTRRMFESDLWRDYVALAVREAGGRDLVFDGYIPADAHERFARAFANLGYVPLPLKTPAPAHTPNELSRRARVESRKHQLFLGACAAGRPAPLQGMR